MSASTAARSRIILLLAAWVALGLFGHDPWKPDEAYTFGIVDSILKAGHWLVPTLAGEPFMEKPPLFFWTAALFARGFGGWLSLPDAARLASGFYAAIALLFAWLAAERRIAAPLFLAGTLGYLQHAHQLITDNALLAGIAIGFYGLRSSRGWVLGTGAGIAFLSKGLLGPGILGLTALLLPVFPAWRQSWKSWPAALVALAPWVLVWPWLLYRQSPALFDEWLWVNNIGRFTGSAQLGGVLDHWLYAKALVWFALPAWPFALWTLHRRPGAPETQLGLLAFAVAFMVLSAASSARTLYGLPMLVPLAVLAALELDSAPAWVAAPLDRLAFWSAALAGVAAWTTWLAFVAAGQRPAWLEALVPGFAPPFQPWLLGGALAVTAFCASLLKLERGLPARWVAGVTLVWGLAMTLWLPWLDYAKTYRGVVQDLERHVPELPDCIASRNLSEPERAMFAYFARMTPVREEGPKSAACPLLLVHSDDGVPPRTHGRWRVAWRGTRPGDTKEWFWLFERF